MKNLIMKLLNCKKRETQKQALSMEQLLNTGLSLAVEFGENWGRPIQTRLKEKYPGLTESELDNFNQICRKSMSYGHEILYRLAEKNGRNLNSNEAIKIINAKYSWIDNKNMSSLISQGIYYAMKDGLMN